MIRGTYRKYGLVVCSVSSSRAKKNTWGVSFFYDLTFKFVGLFLPLTV